MLTSDMIDSGQTWLLPDDDAYLMFAGNRMPDPTYGAQHVRVTRRPHGIRVFEATTEHGTLTVLRLVRQ